MQTGDPDTRRQPALGDRLPLAVDGLTLRLLDPKDFPRERDGELLELLRRAFNGGPSWFGFGVEPLDHFRWKARDFPGVALLELMEDGDTIIGMHVYHAHGYLSQGEELIVLQGADSARDPTYQGRGLKSARRSLRAHVIAMNPWCSYKIGLGAHPLSNRRLGRPAQNELTGNQLLTLVKLISPTRLLWSRLTGRLRRNDGSDRAVSRTRTVLEAQGIGNRPSRSARIKAALALLQATIASPFRRSASAASWTIDTTSQFDERADQFWEQAREQFDVIKVRDREYLNWRFCDPRAGEFIVRTAEEDGALLGYLAFRLEGKRALIADLLALPGRSDVVRSLIDDAVRLAHQNGAYQIRCWSVEGHSYLRELRRAGFANYPNVISLSYGAWSTPSSELTFLADRATRIHFQTSDTDHI